MQRLVWLLSLLLLLAGCTADSSQVEPPRYDPYFPTSVTVSEDDRFMFLLNANADLRYGAGTIQVMDLDALDTAFSDWAQGTAAADCAPDPGNGRVLQCNNTRSGNEPAPWMLRDGSIRTGNFGSAINVQELDTGNYRIFATVRGDPSLTYATFSPQTGVSNCGSIGTFHRCAEENRLDHFFDTLDYGVLQVEPFHMTIDPVTENIFVTHFTSGFVTLGWAPFAEATPPALVDFAFGLFQQTERGLSATGVAMRQLGSEPSWAYVASASEARVAMIYAVPGELQADGIRHDRVIVGPSFFFDNAVQGGTPADARGVEFSADGNRGYVVSRWPAEFQVYDTTLEAGGSPRNLYLGSVEICSQPAQLAIADFGNGPRAYVPCFGRGQLWIIDIERLRLVAVVDVGRGATSVATDLTHKRVYVANYTDHSIAVLDGDPQNVTENQTLLRVGKF